MTALDVQRRLTNAFVARQPVTLSLVGRTSVADGEGGVTVGVGQPRVIVGTLCEPGSSGYGPPSQAADGSSRKVDFLLVAPWDSVVLVDDRFTLDGADYRVEGVLPYNGYEVRAYVVKVGTVAT